MAFTAQGSFCSARVFAGRGSALRVVRLRGAQGLAGGNAAVGMPSAYADQAGRQHGRSGDGLMAPPSGCSAARPVTHWRHQVGAKAPRSPAERYDSIFRSDGFWRHGFRRAGLRSAARF